MDDLVSRLLEAIEKVESKAQRIAEQDEWDESPHDRLRLVINDRYPTALYDDDGYPRGPLLDVLSLADPSSVLRRCAADRRTVEEWLKQVENPFNGLSHEPPYFIVNLAESYGLSDHQEGEE